MDSRQPAIPTEEDISHAVAFQKKHGHANLGQALKNYSDLLQTYRAYAIEAMKVFTEVQVKLKRFDEPTINVGDSLYAAHGVRALKVAIETGHGSQVCKYLYTVHDAERYVLNYPSQFYWHALSSAARRDDGIPLMQMLIEDGLPLDSSEVVLETILLRQDKKKLAWLVTQKDYSFERVFVFFARLLHEEKALCLSIRPMNEVYCRKDIAILLIDFAREHLDLMLKSNNFSTLFKPFTLGALTNPHAEYKAAFHSFLQDALTHAIKYNYYSRHTLLKFIEDTFPEVVATWEINSLITTGNQQEAITRGLDKVANSRKDALKYASVLVNEMLNKRLNRREAASPLFDSDFRFAIEALEVVAALAKFKWNQSEEKEITALTKACHAALSPEGTREPSIDTWVDGAAKVYPLYLIWQTKRNDPIVTGLITRAAQEEKSKSAKNGKQDFQDSRCAQEDKKKQPDFQDSRCAQGGLFSRQDSPKPLTPPASTNATGGFSLNM